MKSGVNMTLDIILLILMLAVCLPILLFCVNTFLNDQTYGFDTFKEKSVQERAYDPRNLWGGNIRGDDINGKTLWTDAHRALIGFVDDRREYNSPGSTLDRDALLAAGNGIVGSYNSSNRYYIKWDVHRSIPPDSVGTNSGVSMPLTWTGFYSGTFREIDR